MPFLWRPRPRGKRVYRRKWRWFIWMRKMSILHQTKMYVQYMKQRLAEKGAKMYKRW